MVGFGETYFSAYALFLGANNFQMGVLTSLPPFLAGLSQFSTVNLMKAIPSRRKLVCLGVLVQILSFVPLYLAYSFSTLRIELYILLVGFYFSTGAVIGPVWNSWMGDLVKYSQRGVYFGRRNRVLTVGTFLAMTIAGLCLRHFKDINMELKGFAVIFLLAISSRLTSFYFLSIKFDPPISIPEKSSPGFLEFLKELPKRNQGMLILYMSAVNLAVYTAAAFFTPLMLKELKFNYGTYTFVVAGTAITKFLTYSIWGECVDKLGPRRVILTSGILISFTTLPWIFTGNPTYLFLSQCYTGIVWAGYEVSTFTFLLDATEPSERAQISSYLNILMGIFGLFGGLLGGGLFAIRHPALNPYMTVFALSGALRILALLSFGLHLKEIRVISAVKARDILFKSTGFKSAMGMTSRLIILGRRSRRGAK